MRLVLKLAVIAAAVWIVAALVPGVHVQEGVLSYVVVAAIFAVVNVLVRPVLKLLSFPLLILTLGLFLIVINAAMLGPDRAADRPDGHRRHRAGGGRVPHHQRGHVGRRQRPRPGPRLTAPWTWRSPSWSSAAQARVDGECR